MKLTKDLINNNIPRLKLQDTVRKALQLIDDFRITHLPVLADNTYLGLISEEDLLDVADDKATLEFLQQHFLNVSVLDNIHFLAAVNSCIQYDTGIVAIVDQQKKYTGAATSFDLLKVLGNFSGAAQIGGIVVVEIDWNQFSISEISRLVESNDCSILHLNSTLNELTGKLTVTLHLNKVEVAAVVATFERYDYDIVYYLGSEKFENELNNNFNNLMNYLDI